MPKKKCCEATTVGTDGVVVQSRRKFLNNHPAASRHPSCPGGVMGDPACQFIHTFDDRARSQTAPTSDPLIAVRRPGHRRHVRHRLRRRAVPLEEECHLPRESSYCRRRAET